MLVRKTVFLVKTAKPTSMKSSNNNNNNINNRDSNCVQRPCRELPHHHTLKLRTRVKSPSGTTGREPSNAPSVSQPSEQRTLCMVLGLRPTRGLSPRHARVMHVCSNTWAPSTTAQRLSLWTRYHKYARLHPEKDIGMSMALFIETLPVMSSTKLTYAKTLAATAAKLDIQVPILRLYASGLAASGGTTPTAQASPATRKQVDTLMSHLPVHLAAPILLAWKTASRWDDVTHLQRQNVTVLSPSRIIVQWSQTKSTRAQPFRASTWTEIVDDDPRRLNPLLEHLQSLRPTDPVTRLSTAQLIRLLRQFPDTQDLTAHSIKRGAIDVLVRAAAEGRLDRHIVCLMAKHKDELFEMPATTLRYVSDKVALARMLGTHLATRLL